MRIMYLVVEADLKHRPFDCAVYYVNVKDARERAALLATEYRRPYEVFNVMLDGTATPQAATFRPAVTLDEPA